MALEDVQAGVKLYAGERASQVAIAVTEYNLIVSPEQSRTPHYGMSLDQGLFLADMIRNLAEMGVPLGNLHSLIDIHEGEGWANTPVLSPYPQLIPRPAAYVLQLFSQHLAPLRIPTRVTAAPLLSGSLPALEVMATRSESGDRLTLLAINKEATTTITSTIGISGFVPVPVATVWTLDGNSITAYNDVQHPTAVQITTSHLLPVANTFTYTFPPHSVTLIELSKKWKIRLPLIIED
jgi:alpha-N-arabinofuranosidase